MGISYYTCHNCGKTFPDCVYFVRCDNCGTKWCDDECAEQDGYMPEHCAKYDISDYDGDLDEMRIDKWCDCDDCGCDCEFFVSDSCKLCRHEEYEDFELLSKALELLDMTRSDLIKRMKDGK